MGSKEAVRTADATGGVMLPAIIALIVGVVRLASEGVHWSAIIMIAGALATWLAVPAYQKTATAAPGRSWGKTAGAASIMLPWAFSLYLIAYEGVYRAYQGINGAGAASILIGLLWAMAGARMLHVLSKITDQSRHQR